MKNPFAVLAGSLSVLGWFVMFGLGLFIASKPYRAQLLQAFEWKAFIVSLMTYTPTNIAALSVLAAFSGGCASQLILATAAPHFGDGNLQQKTGISESEIYMGESPVSSMLRGFAVYIAFLAGVYVGTNAPFLEPTQEQYARAAGTVSLLAFVVGYDPTLFRQLISLGSKFKRE
jgi:hypothetical protein